MERLTERDEFGNADIIALSDMMPEIYTELPFSETNALTDALNRLAAYEDTGLEPCEIDSAFIHGVIEENQRLKKFARVLGLIDSEHTIIPPPNDPLTLEQLREMDGEPVWVIQVNGELRPFWMLVDAEDESAASSLYSAMFEDYGTEWLAYRRKPEEGTV